MDKNNVIPVFLNDDILSGQGYILLSNNSWANAIPGLVGSGSVSGRGYLNSTIAFRARITFLFN